MGSAVPDCLSLWADGNAEGLRIGDDFDRLDAIRPPAHARRPVVLKLAVDVKRSPEALPDGVKHI